MRYAQHLLHRDRHGKTTVEVHVGKRWVHSHIKDVELDLQRWHMTMLEAVIAHRRYPGNAQFDLRLAEHVGVSWFSGQRDAASQRLSARIRVLSGVMSGALPARCCVMARRYRLILCRPCVGT